MDMPPYLKKHGRYYRVQKRVPIDIARVVPLDQRKQVLGTSSDLIQVHLGSDLADAKRRALAELNRIEALFDQLRGQAPAISEVTTERLEAMAWCVYETKKAALEAGLSHRPSVTLDELDVAYDTAKEPWVMGLREGVWDDSTTALVSGELTTRGLPLMPVDPRFQEARRLVARALIDAHSAVFQQFAGDYTYQPGLRQPTAQNTPSGQGGLKVLEVFDKWKAERQLPPKSELEWTSTFNLFTQVVGNKPIRDVVREDVRDFKDALLLMPSSMTKRYPGMSLPEVIEMTKDNDTVQRVAPATINKYICAVSSVFTWAGENCYMSEVNPASKMTVSKKGRTMRRLNYTASDLKAIFSASVFTAGDRPRGGAGEAAKWLPLLGLFTGARLEELGQLLTADVQHEAGIWFLDINDQGDKALKTSASRRKVPVHPELVRCGFLGYALDLREAGEAKLFPALKADALGRLTDGWSKWWARFTDKLNIKEREKVFHSFRHGFKDACRDVCSDEELRDALTGHSGAKSVGRGYGSDGFSLAAKSAVVAAIAFPVDLSHLHVGSEAAATRSAALALLA